MNKKIIFLLLICCSLNVAQEASSAKGIKRTFEETNIESLDESEAKKVKTGPLTFTFISSEGQRFEVPSEIAMQSNLVRTKLRFDKRYGTPVYEYETGIPSNILKTLTNAMKLIDQNSILENKRELYQIIQDTLLTLNCDVVRQYCTYIPLSEIIALFINSIFLEYPLLPNIFADLLAQQLLNDDKTLNQNKLDELVNTFPNQFLDKDWLDQSWYLIEKFYYLRSKNQRPKGENLLIVKNQTLKTIFNIKDDDLRTMIQRIFIFKIASENIFEKWKLSINDLVDYDKVIVYSGISALIFHNFFLADIAGLKRIPNINDIIQLDLSNNRISNLGDHLKVLNSLSDLKLSNNKLTELGDSLHGLENLSDLHLSHNQITNLENSLHGLENLVYLYLSYNQITNLGDSLHGLENLQHLYLEHNQIVDLGDSLRGLDQLVYLMLDYNRITNLGDSVHGLTNLNQLHLDHNQIVDIGDSLNGLDNLQVIVIDNNPLNAASRELIENINLQDEEDDENPEDE